MDSHDTISQGPFRERGAGIGVVIGIEVLLGEGVAVAGARVKVGLGEAVAVKVGLLIAVAGRDVVGAGEGGITVGLLHVPRKRSR